MSDIDALVAWVETTLGGAVTHVERLPRWRAGWFLDLERDGDVIALYARGARGPDFPSPYALAHEVAVHDLLEAHGFPVPHVFGVCTVGETEVMVMQRRPGVQGLAAEADPDVRARLMRECVGHMARMHALAPEELAARGFAVPTTAHDTVWSGAIARLVAHHRGLGGPPDPVIEMLLSWLVRHTPITAPRPAFVTWDAAQFLHHDGELTALIDFELAHVGHPYMDLAPLRSRDTMEPFGDLAGAFAHYAELTDAPIDFDLVRYFEVAQLTATLLLQRPVLLAPDAGSDLVTHLVWYVESARYACDVLAELVGVTLDTAVEPEAGPSPHGAAHAHLVASLHAASRAAVDPYARWRAHADYRLARHLARVDEIGSAVAAAERADAHAVLVAIGGSVVADGSAVDAPEQASLDAALVAVIARDDPAHEVALLQYAARRLHRMSMLLGPPGSLLTRHVPLQPLPDRA